MTRDQKKKLMRVIDEEFLFARDMFLAPVNFFVAALMKSVTRSLKEAQKAVVWSLDENGK